MEAENWRVCSVLFPLREICSSILKQLPMPLTHGGYSSVLPWLERKSPHINSTWFTLQPLFILWHLNNYFNFLVCMSGPLDLGDEAKSLHWYLRWSQSTGIKTFFTVSLPTLYGSQAVVCISKPRMYPRSMYFLINDIKICKIIFSEYYLGYKWNSFIK